MNEYRSNNSTQKQLQMLDDFMLQHRELSTRTLVGRDKCMKLWLEIKSKLNAVGPPVKSVQEWKRVWTTRKYKSKKKLTLNRQSPYKMEEDPNSDEEIVSKEETTFKEEETASTEEETASKEEETARNGEAVIDVFDLGTTISSMLEECKQSFFSLKCDVSKLVELKEKEIQLLQEKNELKKRKMELFEQDSLRRDKIERQKLSLKKANLELEKLKLEIE